MVGLSFDLRCVLTSRFNAVVSQVVRFAFLVDFCVCCAALVLLLVGTCFCACALVCYVSACLLL